MLIVLVTIPLTILLYLAFASTVAHALTDKGFWSLLAWVVFFILLAYALRLL
jgi:hypothetical protein